MAMHSNNPDSLVATAKRLAKKNQREYYIVFEPDFDGNYHVTDDYGLDSFYMGISEQNILWSSWDAQ